MVVAAVEAVAKDKMYVLATDNSHFGPSKCFLNTFICESEFQV